MSNLLTHPDDEIRQLREQSDRNKVVVNSMKYKTGSDIMPLPESSVSKVDATTQSLAAQLESMKTEQTALSRQLYNLQKAYDGIEGSGAVDIIKNPNGSLEVIGKSSSTPYAGPWAVGIDSTDSSYVTFRSGRFTYGNWGYNAAGVGSPTSIKIASTSAGATGFIYAIVWGGFADFGVFCATQYYGSISQTEWGGAVAIVCIGTYVTDGAGTSAISVTQVQYGDINLPKYSGPFEPIMNSTRTGLRFLRGAIISNKGLDEYDTTYRYDFAPTDSPAGANDSSYWVGFIRQAGVAGIRWVTSQLTGTLGAEYDSLSDEYARAYALGRFGSSFAAIPAATPCYPVGAENYYYGKWQQVQFGNIYIPSLADKSQIGYCLDSTGWPN